MIVFAVFCAMEGTRSVRVQTWRDIMLPGRLQNASRFAFNRIFRTHVHARKMSEQSLTNNLMET